MLKVGEKVRYLDDVGEATIIQFIDAKMALVEDEWGLRHKHPINKLVPANRDRMPQAPQPPEVEVVKPLAVAKTTPVKEKSTPLPNLALVFVSNKAAKPETGDLDLFFVNNTNYSLLINVGAKENQEWFSLFYGEVLPGAKVLVQSLRRQDVGTVGKLNVDAIFFGKTGYDSRRPMSCSLKIKATRFVKAGNYVQYSGIENPAIAVELKEKEEAEKPAGTLRRAGTLKKLKKPTLPTLEEEVDLHLECILGTDPSDMTDHQKFQIQIQYFERKLHYALAHNYIQITFIHGVGSGKLKEAVRAGLKEHNLRFEDGPFHKYGVGATVVDLRV